MSTFVLTAKGRRWAHRWTVTKTVAVWLAIILACLGFFALLAFTLAAVLVHQLPQHH